VLVSERTRPDGQAVERGVQFSSGSSATGRSFAALFRCLGGKRGQAFVLGSGCFTSAAKEGVPSTPTSLVLVVGVVLVVGSSLVVSVLREAACSRRSEDPVSTCVVVEGRTAAS
jgi:hypothetical protein